MNRSLIAILVIVAVGVGFGVGLAVKPPGVSAEKYNALVKEREDWIMQTAILKKQADLKVSELQQRLTELEQKLTRSERERNDLKQQACTVTVQPGQSLLQVIETAPEGAVICLSAGVFKEGILQIEQKLKLKTEELERDAALMHQLKDFFGTDQPFDAPLPEHLYKVLDDGTAIFLHFDKPLAEGPTKILYIGDAVPGKFCNTPEVQELMTKGYVHFHTTNKVPTPEAGHGGKGGEDGFWLRHIAVGEFDMPWGHVTPGIDYNFMVTQPPDCP